jgi:NAD+ synthase (glutamine-hydrolysing)
MLDLRIALCQINATVGDVDGNLEKVLASLAQAEDAGADLAVFPELVLTGYPPEDLLLEHGFVEANLRALDAVASATRGCVAVVGFVEEALDLHNAAAVCAGGKVHGVWRKQHLPNYSVFDEQRYFVPGSGAGPLFVIGGVRVGVTICEDSWAPAGPVYTHAARGAQLVVCLNASPYRVGVLAERERMLATRAADASCPIAYVNMVGGQDELVFDGASMLFDMDGTLLASAPQFDETVLVTDLSIHPSYRKRLLDPRGRTGHSDGGPPLAVPVTDPQPERPPARVPPAAAAAASGGKQRLPARLEPAAEVYAALVTGTRDYVSKNGFSDVVIALSGGVDSALVATIAADALGPDKVHGVLMPSRYSSEGSVTDAERLAANLGIGTLVVPVEPVHGAFLELLGPLFDGLPEDLTEENLQSRIRGMVLMALSNKHGWLVLTTGNKSEMAVGYATLYGDMAGGFAVIKDVPKTLVWELCRHRNEVAGRDLVPEEIIAKPPSAELRADQLDTDSLPPYEELDPILEGYVERDESAEELVRAGHDPAAVRKVIALVDRAEYKRRQAPPGVRVTSRAFGKDRRMPITNRYRPGTPQ